MNLMEAFEAYPDIARPVIIKTDVLRLGVTFSKAALETFGKREDILFKGYHLFSWDITEPAMLQQRIPYELFLDDGTLIQMRLAKDTPYLVDVVDGDYRLYWNREEVAKGLRFNTKARYCYRALEDGTPFEAYVKQAGEDAILCCPTKFCEYFTKDLQCLYCDSTTFAATQKRAGETMVLRKEPEIAAQILDIVFHESGFRHILITGGSFFTTYHGLTEVEWYARFLETIVKRIGAWYGAALQMTALDDEGCKRIHDTGIPSIQFNIEVWDKRLFKIICPGKDAYVGYDEWISRTINAVKYWGPGNVNPGFVSGVEMAKPFGFEKYEDAVKSRLAGYEFLMSNGVLPRQGSVWAAEGYSKLAGQAPTPLEYHLEIGRGYLELREKHGFHRPPFSNCRHCDNHSTGYDWEYYQGHGAASKKAEESSLLPVRS